MKTFKKRLIDFVVDAVIIAGVLMIASPLGMLLEAVVDTIRYGHPR